MITKLLVQMIFKTIVATVFLMASTMAFAQSQTNDAAVDLQKQSDVKPSEQLNDNKVEKVQRAADNNFIAVKREPVKPQTITGNYFTGRKKITDSKNPFANETTAKLNSPAKQTSSGSGWQFGFAPYLFASGTSGTIGARGRSIDIDLSFGDVLKNLKVGLMGTFEARKGKLFFVSDLIWTKMSSDKNTSGPLYSTADLGVNLFIFDPEVGYRAFESEKGSVDVLGGIRVWSVENNLNLTTGLLPGFDVSQRKSWAAPVVGVRGLMNLSPKFFLTGKFDIGGAGIGADLTTQFFGGAGYRIKSNVAIIGGYRYLQVDYDDSSGFIFDTKMSGLIFGAKFSF